MGYCGVVYGVRAGFTQSEIAACIHPWNGLQANQLTACGSSGAWCLTVNGKRKCYIPAEVVGY